MNDIQDLIDWNVVLTYIGDDPIDPCSVKLIDPETIEHTTVSTEDKYKLSRDSLITLSKTLGEEFVITLKSGSLTRLIVSNGAVVSENAYLHELFPHRHDTAFYKIKDAWYNILPLTEA